MIVQSIGGNTVTLTVTDVNGNVSECQSTVTVVDDILPEALCAPASITLVGGTAILTPDMVDDGSNDACGIASMTVYPNTFDCSEIGDHSVILTVTDNNGNVSTCETTATVVGEVPSCDISFVFENNTYTGGDGYTIFLGYGPQALTATANPTGGSSFTYNWTGGSGYLSSTTSANPVFTPTQEGYYTLECTVTNEFGCETTCSLEICVLDIRAGGNGNNAKVYLCHVPNGNPNKAKTIKVSVNAVPGHLGNHSGDKLGRCDQSCDAYKDGFTYTAYDGDHDPEITIYPNPTRKSFNLIIESHNEEEINAYVYDASGRVKASLEKVEPHLERSFGDDLPVGFYYVRIIQGEFVKTVKVIKLQ